MFGENILLGEIRLVSNLRKANVAALIAFTILFTNHQAFAGEGGADSNPTVPIGVLNGGGAAPQNRDGSIADASDIPLDQLLRLDYQSFLQHVRDTNLKFHDPAVEDYPFYHVTNGLHRARVLNDGVVALEMRLRMIERAQSKIDYMTYMFNPDLSGRLVLRALAERAREGVNVRILVDWYNETGKPGLDDYVAAAAKLYASYPKITGRPVGSFEVHYYNRGQLNLSNFQRMSHRNHVKFLVADDRELLIGGRNTADDYFSMAKTGLNWLDRDIWTYSTSANPYANVAIQARNVFGQYWSDLNWTTPSRAVVQDAASVTATTDQGTAALRAAWNILAGTQSAQYAEDARVRKDVALQGLQIIGPVELDLSGEGTGEVPLFSLTKLTLVVDRPAPALGYRRVTPMVNWRLANARGLVMIENYIVPVSAVKFGILSYLAQVAKVPIMILTNNLVAVDSPGGAPRLGLFTQRDLVQPTANISAFNLSGRSEPTQVRLDGWSYSGNYGTHAKTTVMYDPVHAATMIGSYNFDERSELINNEGMLVVEDNLNLAAYVARSIKNRFTDSHRLMSGPGGRPYYTDNTPINDPGQPFWMGLANFFGFRELVRLEY